MPKRLLSVLACGYILMFYSEHMFWAQYRASEGLLDYVYTWLLYSFMAFIFLSVITHFRIRSLWGLFLAGAVFGWLTEGVIVQTTYESLPLSISFTALAWHAPLSVFIGWYAVRKAIKSGVFSTVKLAVAIGIFYGLWAISWWGEPEQIAATPLEFATFSLLTTLPLLVAYWTYDRTISSFTVGRIAKIVVAGLLLLYFVFVTIPVAPIAIIIMPILLLLVYVVLRRNQKIENRPSLLETENQPPPLQNYLAVLMIPITAIAIYVVAYAQGLLWHTNWLVYLVTTPLGFLLLGMSLYKVWRGQRRAIKGVPDENSGFVT